jgi:hypothetical protein
MGPEPALMALTRSAGIMPRRTNASATAISSLRSGFTRLSRWAISLELTGSMIWRFA